MTQKRPLIWVFACWSAAACGGSLPPTQGPTFKPPEQGVFYAPAPLAAGPDDELFPALADVGNRLIYAAEVSGNVDIYRRDLDDGATIRLTDHSTADTDPAFSPDGRQVAWVSEANDVKGDIWVMAADGRGARPLTDRTTQDRSPAWSGDGRRIYFTTAGADLRQQVAWLDLETRERQVVVDDGWDPAPSPRGDVLVYVALDPSGRTRLKAIHLRDGAVVDLTDGTAVEGFPRAHLNADVLEVVFTRFVDDLNNDGVIDTEDPPSVWRLRIPEDIFENPRALVPVPLTGSEGGEIFALPAGNVLAYTSQGLSELNTFALPANGVIAVEATGDAVLAAARAQENPALRRLAYRYVIATSPEAAREARYQLARDLSQRGNYVDARTELERTPQDGVDELSTLVAMELARVSMLAQLQGTLIARTEQDRRYTKQAVNTLRALARTHLDSARIQARRASAIAEGRFALGDRLEAINAMEKLAGQTDAPTEDRARVLARLAEIYAGMDHLEALERVTLILTHEFVQVEGFLVRQAAELWIATATRQRDPGPLVGLAKIRQKSKSIPVLRARVQATEADLQESAGRLEVALERWQDLLQNEALDRALLARALFGIARLAKRQRQVDRARAAYERVLGEFTSDGAIRQRARRELLTLALAEARRDERLAREAATPEARRERLELARRSYRVLWQNNRELVQAHRRYVGLSAELGRRNAVVEETRKRAGSNPQDPYFRYAYGLALTYGQRPNLDAAEREVLAALEIDPRFGAAYLTHGWIQLQRYYRKSLTTFAERAFDNFSTASNLFEEAGERVLGAAAQLNMGHALREIGKNDAAFEAYLERERAAIPFSSTVTEAIFREMFSRVALKVGHYDVAIDQGRRAYPLAQALNTDRQGATAALTGAAYFLGGAYQDAAQWYSRAVAFYRARDDGPRLVATVRARALAHRYAGAPSATLEDLGEVLALLADERGPADLTPPTVRGFVSELPADSGDVTRAPYGFSSTQEQAIAARTQARIFRQRGYTQQATRFDALHLQLLAQERENPIQAARTREELLFTLHESALIAVQHGDVDRAQRQWTEAVRLAVDLERTDALLRVLNSLLRLPTHPKTSSVLDPQVLVFANEALGRLLSTEPATARRLARWLTLYHLGQALAPLPPQPTDIALEARVRTHLSFLDARGREFAWAQDFGWLATDTKLRAHWDPSTTPRPPCEETVKENCVVPPSQWQERFDRAVASRNNPRLYQRWLELALGAWEQAEPSDAAPEERALATAAALSLAQKGDTQRAWKVLERWRLRTLIPPDARLQRPDRLARQRDFRARQPADLSEAQRDDTPAWLLAVTGLPVSAARLGATLGNSAVLLQQFSPTENITFWSLVDRTGVRLLVAGERESLPPAVLAALPSPETGTTIYWDAGERPLAESVERQLSEASVDEWVAVLSGTYAVAAHEARTVARGTPSVVGEGPSPLPTRSAASPEAWNSLAPGQRAVHLAAILADEAPGLGDRPSAQALFQDPTASAGLDLDDIGNRALDSELAIVTLDAPTWALQRGVAQAFLLAGVPTVVFLSARSASRVAVLTDATREQRPAALIAAWNASKSEPRAHIFGHRGLGDRDRVQFSSDLYVRLRNEGVRTYSRAVRESSPALRRVSAHLFQKFLEVIQFLREPESQQLLETTEDLRLSRLASQLTRDEFNVRRILGDIYDRLGDTEKTANILELLIETQKSSGNNQALATLQRRLGQTHFGARAMQPAAEAYRNCIASAAAAENLALEADCRSRLGSALRALFDYNGAIRAYQQSMLLYAQLGDANELFPRRYLGFLYESSLNAYRKALAQFKSALELARRYEQSAIIPKLLIDIARVHRLRSDYETALSFVEEAASLLPDGEKAEAELEAARIYWYRGNYRRAQQYQQQSLASALRARNDFLEIQARSLAGLIALRKGELRQAETYLADALALSRTTGRKSEEAAQLNNLGIVLLEGGRNDEAIERFKASLAIDRELETLQGQAFDLRWLATAEARLGAYPKALSTLAHALELSQTVGNTYNALYCHLLRGEIYEKQGKPEATTELQSAAALARETSVPEVEWRARYALGRLARQNEDRPTARNLFEEALQVAERLGRGQTETSREYTRDTLFEAAIELALADGDVASVFNYTERARGRDLLDVLASATLDLPTDEAKRLLNDELRTREALVRAPFNSAKRIPLERKYRQARQRLVSRYPNLARTLSPVPVSLQDVKQRLPATAQLVSYYVGSQFSVALMISNEQSAAVRLDVTRAELSQATAQLQERMRVYAPVDVDLAKLARWLLRPLPRTSSTPKTMVFIPHGPIHLVPFAALPTTSGRSLLDTSAIAQAPSASLLVDLLTQNLPPAVDNVWALAHGDDLPFATLQVGRTASRRRWLGAEATVARLRSVQADALDIAAHGDFRRDEPLTSAVLLAPGPEDDGRLELREVFSLQGLPSLVSLGTCHAPRDGHAPATWLAFTHSFLSAGPRTVIAGQGEVSDLSSAILLKRFYRYVRSLPRAEALRQSALAVRRYFAHPAHWATLVAVGDFR